MRTPALVTATPVSHQQPQAAPAAADTTQVLPVGTWGLGLAPRAAGMAPPAVLAAAAAAAFPFPFSTSTPYPNQEHLPGSRPERTRCAGFWLLSW